MERMSLFYESIINKAKIEMDFSLCKSLLSFLFERRDDFNEFKEWKDFLNINDKKLLELEQEQKLLREKKEKYKNQKKELEDDLRKNERQRWNIINNEIKQLNNEIKDNNSYLDIEIENIRRLDTVIKNNRSFLIPSSTEILSKKKCENSKTNVCKICKYNCHKNCKHSFKRTCSCFNWRFKCKYCPNKCPVDAHEITNYEYPNYDYGKQ